MNLLRSALTWLPLSFLVIIVDQTSKLLVVRYISYRDEYVPLWPSDMLGLIHVHNNGAAFSFLADESGWQKILFGGVAVLVSAVIVAWLRKTPADRRLVCSSLALVLGGAIGNLIDRSVYSYVIDFILVHYKDVWSYPAFNIADSAICVGAAMLVIDALFDRKHPEKGGSAGKPDGEKPEAVSPEDSAGKGGEA